MRGKNKPYMIDLRNTVLAAIIMAGELEND